MTRPSLRACRAVVAEGALTCYLWKGSYLNWMHVIRNTTVTYSVTSCVLPVGGAMDMTWY